MEQLKPHVADYAQKYLSKKKYYDKTLSADAIWTTYLRAIDVEPLMPYYLWLEIYPFDLAQLGIGLIFSIAGELFEPLSLGFRFVMPTHEELLSGLLAKFEEIDWSILFPELKSVDAYVDLNIQRAFKPTTLSKAYYGRSRYDESYYDPQYFVEVLTATIWRLSKLKPSDPLYKQAVSDLSKLLNVREEVLYLVIDKVSLLASAQEQAFILGLSPLGRGQLQEAEGGYVKVSFVNHRGEVLEVKVRHASDMLYGFILGVTPLGYGLLLPDKDVHKLEADKGDPRMLAFLKSKVKSILETLPLLALSFSNYQTFEEIEDHHANLRVSQYDALRHLMSAVERFVEESIPRDEADPVRIRQYKNAVLQYIGWRTKRHAWGMDLYKQMSEEEYRAFWLNYWTTQGLKESTLNKLYEGMKVWMKAILREKQSLSSKVQAIRKSLALT